MLDEYKLQGQCVNHSIELEKEVSSALEAMAEHMNLKPSEIVNTALKGFIARHKDFLPDDYQLRASGE